MESRDFIFIYDIMMLESYIIITSLLPSMMGFASRICCSIQECWPLTAARNWRISLVDSVLPAPLSPLSGEEKRKEGRGGEGRGGEGRGGEGDGREGEREGGRGGRVVERGKGERKQCVKAGGGEGRGGEGRGGEGEERGRGKRGEGSIEVNKKQNNLHVQI